MWLETISKYDDKKSFKSSTIYVNDLASNIIESPNHIRLLLLKFVSEPGDRIMGVSDL